MTSVQPRPNQSSRRLWCREMLRLHLGPLPVQGPSVCCADGAASRALLRSELDLGAVGGRKIDCAGSGGTMRRSIRCLYTLTLVCAAVAAVPARAVGATWCAGRVATIIGTSRNDELVGTRGPDVIAALDGDDRIDGLGGDDRICGGRGRDRQKGQSGDDVIVDDSDPYGNLNAKVAWGGPGDDRIHTGRTEERNYRFGSVFGGGGADKISGPRNAFGSGGNDFLRALHADPGAGDDRVLGYGRSRVFYVKEKALHINMERGVVKGHGTDRVSKVNFVDGSRHDDVFIGSDGDDYFLGLDGDDIIRLGGGDDMGSGYEGSDIVRGGTGADVIAAHQGNDRVFGGAGRDRIDAYTRDASELYGGPSHDVVVGGLGDDRIEGGPGHDVLGGGRGDDSLRGGTGIDIAAFEVAGPVDPNLEGVNASLPLGRATGPTSGTDTLNGFEGLAGTGEPDVLEGDDSPNILIAGGGFTAEDDNVTGGAGDDVFYLWYGEPNLTADGGLGSDWLSLELRVEDADSWNFGSCCHPISSVENLIGGTGPSSLSGDEESNILFGNLGDDTLDGSTGFDAVLGSAGLDSCTGAERTHSCESADASDPYYTEADHRPSVCTLEAVRYITVFRKFPSAPRLAGVARFCAGFTS